MSKLKRLLPGIFGHNKDSKTKNDCVDANGCTIPKGDKGRLETDALPVDEENNGAGNCTNNNNNTPTASTELTESVVRELSDRNFNSMEGAANNNEFIAESNTLNANSGALATQTNNALAPTASDALGTTTMNTMNVHNAQQQMVMQFSNINKLHFGAVYNINTNLSAVASDKPITNSNREKSTSPGSSTGGVTESSKRQHPRKTTTIVAMMQSQEEPSHRILETISTHLGEGWKHVMRELGLSEGQIEQALIDHQIHGGIKEVIYQLLLQWLQDADDGVATLGHISTLLWELNHRDCVQRMKLVYKSNDNARKKSS